MRKLVIAILKKIGIPWIELIEELPNFAFYSFLWERFIMLARGIIILHKLCFLGKNVKIKCKKKVKIGKFVTIQDNTYLDACSERGIIIEDYCTIGMQNYIRTGNLFTVKGFFVMKRNSSTNRGCYLGATGGIEIGENVLLGPNITIISETHIFDRVDLPIKNQGIKALPVKIEDGVWIGTNVIVLGGVTIGKDSIIGASSLVNKNIPPRSIAFGIPAKPVRERG